MTYRTILADPPWPVKPTGTFSRHQSIATRAGRLAYPLMDIDSIASMPVESLAEDGCHLWLWTTNGFLRQAFDVMDAWGFQYLSTVTWVKPSGIGAWFANTTQHMLFGYYKSCKFERERYKPTHFIAPTQRVHSVKPEESYTLIERISPPRRLELFSRKIRHGWDAWGNEIDSIQIDCLTQWAARSDTTSELDS